MAELMCLESLVESRARLDPVIFRDSRILDNMLAMESASVVSLDYFATVQKDNNIRPYMRADIVKWMMEVRVAPLMVVDGATPERGPRFRCREFKGAGPHSEMAGAGGGGRVLASRPPAASVPDHPREPPREALGYRGTRLIVFGVGLLEDGC
jgi:hypothetical protein